MMVLRQRRPHGALAGLLAAAIDAKRINLVLLLAVQSGLDSIEHKSVDK